MNLNAYDDLKDLDKSKPWYCPKFARIYIKVSLGSKLYYKFIKRVDVKNNTYGYYLVLTNDYTVANAKQIVVDNYARMKLNVPNIIINDTSLRNIKCDTNIVTELIDNQPDGEVYRLCI